MDIKKIEQMGMEQGFSHVVLLDCDTIELKPEVRQMCAADTCHKYDSAGAVLRDVALLRNVKRKSGSISMGLLFRQLVNWRIFLMARE